MTERRTSTDSLADIISILVDQVGRMGETMEQSNAQLVNRIDDLAVQIGSQVESIGKLEKSIDRLTENIDRVNSNIDHMNSNIDQRLNQLAQSIDGHLRVAEAQTANITELTKLVATQAATVNKLLDRAVA